MTEKSTSTLPRISAETLTAPGATRKTVILGFTREKVLHTAILAALALIPEDEREEIKNQFRDALKQNELGISFGLKDGRVDPENWMITAGNPEVIERPVVLGGTSKVPAIGRMGTPYLRTNVFKNSGIVNGALASLGISKAARHPSAGGFVYGTPPGQTPESTMPRADGGSGDASETDVSGGDGNDFPV